LALVVARPVLVGFAELTGDDRPLHGAQDVVEGDVARRAGEDVATADAPLRAHQPGALEGQQDLLEVGLGQARALGDVAHRRRSFRVGVQGQREQRPTGVVPSGRHLHGSQGYASPSTWPLACEVSPSRHESGGPNLHWVQVGPIHSPAGERILVDESPLLPDYSGACISNVVPALLEPWAERPAWLPA